MNRGLRFTILWSVAVLAVWHWSADEERPRVVTAHAQDESRVADSRRAERDSLRQQLLQLREIVAELHSSFAAASEESLQTDESRRAEQEAKRREIIDLTVQEFSGALSEMREELADIDIAIDGNTIELTDEDGGVVAIAIPENLGEHISRGISSITRVVLDELPDTVKVVTPSGSSWSYEASAPRVHRRIVRGDAIRFRDDLIVAEDEEIRGDAVVVFGDALISGRVTGDVVVVLGDLRIDESAQVDGKVVTVLGRLDRAETAPIGSVVIIDPGSFDFGPGHLLSGWPAFLIKQGLFLVTLLLTVTVIAVTPRPRFDNVQNALTERPAHAFGLGLVVTLAGHAAVVLVGAVLVFTVIGIPLALLLLLGVGLISLLAIGTASVPVGRMLLQGRRSAPGGAILAATVGMCVLHLANFLGSLLGTVDGAALFAMVISGFGIAIKALAYLFGIGALALSRFGSHTAPAPSFIAPRAAVDPDVA